MKERGKGLVIVRTHKSLSYTTLKLSAIEDPRLSYKAKGLHTYLVSRPPDWEIYYHDLLARATDGKDSVTSGIKEIKKYGYLDIERVRERGRIVGTIWHVYEEPQGETTNSPYPEKPDTENPYAGNPQQNNNTTKSKKQNTTTTSVVIESEKKEQRVRSTTHTEEELNAIVKGTPFERVDYQQWIERPDLLDQIDKLVQTYAEDFNKAKRPHALVVKVMRDGAMAPDNYVPYQKRKVQEKAKAVKSANERMKKDSEKVLQQAMLKKFNELSEQERNVLLTEASVKLGPILGASRGMTVGFALQLLKERQEVTGS